MLVRKYCKHIRELILYSSCLNMARVLLLLCFLQVPNLVGVPTHFFKVVLAESKSRNLLGAKPVGGIGHVDSDFVRSPFIVFDLNGAGYTCSYGLTSPCLCGSADSCGCLCYAKCANRP